MNAIQIETDDEATDVMCSIDMTSRDLRKLASNAGVSRKRGDTKRKTAERIVMQDPALTARIIENDPVVDLDASAFRERREVGADRISLEEAERRARHDKMEFRLGRLRRALAAVPSYEAEVDWEHGGEVVDGTGFRESAGYEPGMTSVTITHDDENWDGNGLAAYRGHALLSPTGRARILNKSSFGGDHEYVEAHSDKPKRAWRLFVRAVEGFYEPAERDEE